MTSHGRIATIYKKELTDILRDRRTLVAMVLVPIVLYPLLMLGSIQAVTYQAESLGDEELIVGVVGEDQGAFLNWLIQLDHSALKRQRSQAGEDATEATELPTSLVERTVILRYESREQLEEMIRVRVVHVGVVFKVANLVKALDAQNSVDLIADREVIRSEAARHRIEQLLRRTSDRIVKTRKLRHNLPELFDEPFKVKVTDLSSPASILGQILPLILVLMTITGAIYPAIDLTAGERERGTLESLMSSPVPTFDLIVGKFLVVTTVAIMGATLNLVSVSATVYVGGFDKVISNTGGGIPVATMLLILLCLIPFAIFMSAIMIAVCSYARTFKEAQNYVTPVIVAVLIPCGIAALPTTTLEGAMLVMPVGNMVLLARDLLLGAAVSWWHVLMVVLSTTLYAAAAVAVAASVFGKESVVFADAASWKTLFSRRFIKPAAGPPAAMGLTVVALLFPTWFFIQSLLSPGPDENAVSLLFNSAWLMLVLFLLLPLAVLLYWKVDVRSALALRVPPPRFIIAGILIGLSAWVPTHELNVIQAQVCGIPKAVMESAELMSETLSLLPTGSVLVLLALVPAVCEEFLFRGLLLSSLRRGVRKWPAIVVSACIFAVFHFWLFRFAVTGALGVVLAYICWQSRSIIPAMIVHLLHNGISVLGVIQPKLFGVLGLDETNEWGHYPPMVLVLGTSLFLVGILIASRRELGEPSPSGQGRP